MRRAVALAFAVAAGAVSGAAAQESGLVTTRHSIEAGGATLRYTARAGYVPIRDNATGEVRAKVFFVSYALDDAGADRPVTFVWNGGPGSNSVLVHLVGFGPRRIGDDGSIEDNPDTWLAATDLVFVDPVGTGFSRPARPEYAQAFYSVLGDIDATAEFVRAWRTRFDALQRPLFLAGESYGTWRAAGVAEKLAKARQRITGVILISGGIPFGPVATDAERTAMFVPNRTAAAFFHHKLAPDLQRDLDTTLRTVEQWARDVYAPALTRIDSLDAATRDRIAAELARFTGVTADRIDRKTLAMSSPDFRAALLENEGRTAGRYDMRVTTQAETPGRAVTVRRYLQGELGFQTDLAYQGLETGWNAGKAPPSVGARWEWDQAPPGATVASAGSGDGPPGGPQPWLRRAMEADTSLRAFVAAGLYDSLNGCADNDFIVDHLDPAFRPRFTTGCYDGGHMMYDTPSARRALAHDITTFLQSRPR